MYNKLVLWVEEYLFYPSSFFQYLLAFLLFPFSLIYCAIVISKRLCAKKIKPPLPVVSIGNLTLGGSGKTPFLISLSQDLEDIAIVLRGYKRASKGTLLVSKKGEILTDVSQSGDEAMLYAKSLSKATVIVSEDRLEGIELAKEIGSNAVFLDDGFSKAHIEKFDILLRPSPEPKLPLCIPSGAYREPKWLYKKADLVVEENRDFQRVVEILNPTERMILVTAISKPSRLDKYLPDNLVAKEHFADHYTFSKDELENLLLKHSATSILTTTKDAVKMADFGLPLSILSLHVKINPSIKKQVNTFLANFR